MMLVELSTSGPFKATDPRPLFDGPYVGTTPLRSYDVTADGQFLMTRQQQDPPDERITRLNVVLGWADDLKRRVPTR